MNALEMLHLYACIVSLFFSLLHIEIHQNAQDTFTLTMYSNDDSHDDHHLLNPFHLYVNNPLLEQFLCYMIETVQFNFLWPQGDL